MVRCRGCWNHNIRLWLAVLLIVACSGGCSNSAEPEYRNHAEPQILASDEPPPPFHAGDLDLVPIGEQILNKAAISVEQLMAIIDQFLSNPDQETYALVRFAWLNAVSQIEPFALYAQISLVPTNTENRLDAIFEDPYHRLACWPIEPGFLDGFGEHPYSGIVFDISIPLSVSSIRSQHQITSLREATVGLYALGSILFGPDYQRSTKLFEAQETLSDDAVIKGYQTTDELPNNRRRTLIQLQASLIADDLAKLHSVLTSKKPGGFSALMDSLPRSQQIRVVHDAVKNQFAKQLLSLAEFQKMHRADLLTWNQHIFAKRLDAQLSGWLVVAKQLPLPEKDFLIGESQHASKALANIIAKPFEDNVENESVRKQWSLVFQHLGQISARLNQTQLN